MLNEGARSKCYGTCGSCFDTEFATFSIAIFSGCCTLYLSKYLPQITSSSPHKKPALFLNKSVNIY
jgi:hypothetical protein